MQKLNRNKKLFFIGTGNVIKKTITVSYYFFKIVSLGYVHMRNRLILQFKNIVYSEMPRIEGRIYVSNLGACTFGKGLSFNCSLTSNWVGLYKPCTLSISKGATLIIGDYSGFSGVSIFCNKSIIIGNYVNCGGNVCIWDTDFHPLDFKDRRVHDIEKIKSAAIKVGDDVFIGANSIILKGVVIGDRAIVGAGTVVTKDIPHDEIWAGNPAKFIRKLM